MPGKSEIMRAVRKGLDKLPVEESARNAKWTKAVKRALCEIGRDGFECKVCASGVDTVCASGVDRAADYGE